MPPRRSSGVLALALAPALTLGCNGATGPEREIAGQRMYEQYCARCHGVQGEPVAGIDPPCDEERARCDAPGGSADPACAPRMRLQGCMGSFQDRDRMDGMSDETFKGAVMGGRPAGRRPTGVPPGKGMPAFPTQFTEATMMVLVAYVRGLSGSQGPHAPEPGDDAR